MCGDVTMDAEWVREVRTTSVRVHTLRLQALALQLTASAPAHVGLSCTIAWEAADTDAFAAARAAGNTLVAQRICEQAWPQLHVTCRNTAAAADVVPWVRTIAAAHGVPLRVRSRVASETK